MEGKEIFVSDLLDSVKDRFEDFEKLDFGVVTDDDLDFVSVRDPFVYISNTEECDFFIIERYEDIDVVERFLKEE